MYVTITPADQATAEVELEAKVFYARFRNTKSDLHLEYAPYASNSLFLGVWTDDGRLAAAMRIIMGSAGRLKTLDDLGKPPWSLDPRVVVDRADIDISRTWDIATISVDRWATRTAGGVAGEIAADYIYLALFVCSVKSEVQTWTAMIDDHVLALLHRNGITFHLLPQAFSAAYLGSPRTSPAHANVDQVVTGMAQRFPERFLAMTRGSGTAGLELTGLSAPPLEPPLAA